MLGTSEADAENPGVWMPDVWKLDVPMLGVWMPDVRTLEVRRRHCQMSKGWYVSADAAANLPMMEIYSKSIRNVY